MIAKPHQRPPKPGEHRNRDAAIAALTPEQRARYTPEQLHHVPEIGPASTPDKVRIATYRIRQVELVREPDREYPGADASLTGSYAAYALLKPLADEDREHFVTVLLDQHHHVTGLHVVSVGSLSASIVHPREVFKVVLLTNAAALILAHNHPSGDPTPSKEDLEITRRLRQGAELLGIRLLDHLVIGRGRYVSFVDDGYW